MWALCVCSDVGRGGNNHGARCYNGPVDRLRAHVHRTQHQNDRVAVDNCLRGNNVLLERCGEAALVRHKDQAGRN